MIRKEAFKVRELDCAEEVNLLRGALGRRPGILALDFDIVSARMTATFDDEKISSGMIAAIVVAAGMTAVKWEEAARPEEGTYWQRNGRLIMTCVSGGFLVLSFLTHWAIHRDLLDALAVTHVPGHIFPLPSILLCVAGIATGAWFVFPKAVQSAKSLRPDMNLLMVIAVLGAMAISQWFEAATVSFLFAVALLLEHWSVARARRAISALLDLSPALAQVVPAEGAAPVAMPVASVPKGSVVVARPGDRIPLDGLVLTGSSHVNQAPITGESVPIPKGRGDEVYAGTINVDGTLEFEVNRTANDTKLAHIIHLVRQSQARRARSEQWVDRFALYYTPATMAFAIAVAVVPPLLFGAAWSGWFYRGLVLLVIGCPCALVISTPVSIVAALTSAARNGVLVKGGIYLEAAGRLKVVALDKTGTLTHGRPEVQRVIALDSHTPDQLLARAAAVEADSVHPLAEAILRKASNRGMVVQRALSFRSIGGKGAEGTVAGRNYWVGSHNMMHEKGKETDSIHDAAVGLEDAGHTVVAVGSDNHVCGLISLADDMRQNAKDVVGQLKALGIEKVVMLTGDNEGTARSIADATGVDEWHAELLPEGKVAVVESLVKRHGQVAVVGDGVNDAPAMAAATFGVAMGAIGSDAAIETADVTLMSDDLARLPWLITHSRNTLRVIKQNVTFALGVKALFIVLALLGVATLWMAIAADMGASLLVIFNGLRLLGEQLY
jgi:Cd2+/Zn2+-exporting ATPase